LKPPAPPAQHLLLLLGRQERSQGPGQETASSGIEEESGGYRWAPKQNPKGNKASQTRVLDLRFFLRERRASKIIEGEICERRSGWGERESISSSARRNEEEEETRVGNYGNNNRRKRMMTIYPGMLLLLLLLWLLPNTTVRRLNALLLLHTCGSLMPTMWPSTSIAYINALCRYVLPLGFGLLLTVAVDLWVCDLHSWLWIVGDGLRGFVSLVVVVVVVVAERRYKLSAQVLPGLHWWENSSPAPGGLLWDRSHLVRCSFSLSRTILSLDSFLFLALPLRECTISLLSLHEHL